MHPGSLGLSPSAPDKILKKPYYRARSQGETPLKLPTFLTETPEQTLEVGEHLGRLMPPGTVLALQGDLGAGKTVLTKGIARGLGIDEDEVTSPTYTLISAHEGRIPLYHMDLYRLSGPEEFEYLGADEIMESQGITVIEWSERAGDLLPPGHGGISLQASPAGSGKRVIILEGDALAPLASPLAAELDSLLVPDPPDASGTPHGSGNPAPSGDSNQ